MRSVIIIAVVLLALIGGFALLMMTQGTTKAYKIQAQIAPTPLPPPVSATQGDLKLGTGNEVWIQGFNKKTGELSNEFRADRYDPPVGNKVHVIHPDSRFYENNGEVLTVKADYGDMVMAEGAKKPGQMEMLSTEPPQNGILHNVTLGLLENTEATVPIVTAKLPILAFDNDTLRMNTVDWKNGDMIVPADQVPVVVRGRDYDFDGQGLVLRYNQRDQRLEFLQVAHGKRLLIKNTQAFNATPTPGAAQPDQPQASAMPLQMDGRPIELVSADPTAAPQMSEAERERHREKRAAATRAATRPARPARRPSQHPLPASKPASTKPVHEPVAYRAHFEDDVHLKEGDTPIGDADQMFVTFMQQQSGRAATQASTQFSGATQPTSTIATDAQASSMTPPNTNPRRPRRTPATSSAPASAPSSIAQASPQPIPQPGNMFGPRTTGPATQPNQPIEVTWTGKLTVIPQNIPESGLHSETDHIFEFHGRPVHLNRQGSSVVAPYVWAATEGDRFKAVSDPAFPTVTLKNPDGATLVTPYIDSDGDNVVIRGKSVADTMLAQSNGGPPQKVVTHWDDVANLHLTTTDSGTRAIQHATFHGNVDVLHPQLHLLGDTLALGFIPVAGKDQPALSTVHVDGHVNATVTGEDGTVQTIKSHVLDLATAQQDDGSITIRQMHANGDVEAEAPNQKLLTDDLVAFLLPTPVSQDPSQVNKINIDHMTATGNVKFNTPDGNAATADVLKVDRTGDDMQLITLTGTPATVTNPQSHVTGKLIKLDSTGDHAAVAGAGTLDSVAQQDGSSSAQPIRIVWSKSLDYDGKDDRAKILGDVVINSIGQDGAHDKATGQILDVTLADAPSATQPSATQTASTSNATTQPFASGSKKTVKTLTLSNPTPTGDGVEVSSIVYDPDNATRLIKRTYLFAPLVTVDTNPDGTMGAMTVPSAGRLLYEDRSGATTRPTTGPASTQPAGEKGMMAMEWKKRMIYNPTAHTALLEGDVVAVHEAPGQDMMRMLAPRLIATLDDSSGSSQIKQVDADQGATFLGKSVRIDSASATYLPEDNRMIARGTPREQVQVYDDSGLSSGAFSEVWWNTQTNQPERMVNVTAHINRVGPQDPNAQP